MLEQLQSYWQGVPPQAQAALREAGLVVVVLLAGHFLGAMVARVLRARNFDATLRLPGAAPPGPQPGIGPTFLAGVLVRLTIWAGLAWWLARQYERPEIAATVALVLTRTWALATVLVMSLALASLLARRVMECLQRPDVLAARNGAGASGYGLAGVVGAGVYLLVLLLALLIAADFFDWPLTRSSALALWQLAQHLLTAGSALLIGCLGARWARDLMAAPAAASPEQRAAQYTSLGIVAATTVLAVAMLVSSASLFLGLGVLAVVGLLLWLVRDHLPDISAGLQLRAHRVKEVYLDGEAWKVAQIGLLATELMRAGSFNRLPNRQVLHARLHAAPLATNPR
jgi:hypothetical protein